MALSPKGACIIPLRRFIKGRAECYGSSLKKALSPKRACGWLREFIRRFERRTPLAKVNLGPLPQGGVRYSAPPVYLGGVRWFAPEVADPLAILRMALSPKGACEPFSEFIEKSKIRQQNHYLLPLR